MLPLHGSLSRRQVLAGVAGGLGLVASRGLAAVSIPPASSPESLAGMLHASLTPAQREAICFPWDYAQRKFGLLRTRVGANWNATEPEVASDFYTADQQELVRAIFDRLIEPEWHARFARQMEDDCGGFGHGHTVALIGEPGSGKFQFLMTGRHMTLRCDGDSADHVAFGGPIFYGHDAGGGDEEKDHPGNVFWPQALAANRVFEMLDGRQRGMRPGPAAGGKCHRLSRPAGADPRHPSFGTLARPAGGTREGAGDPARALPHDRSRGGSRLPRPAGRPRRLPAGLLLHRRHRRRQGLGQLAAGRPVVRLALPRRARMCMSG